MPITQTRLLRYLVTAFLATLMLAALSIVYHPPVHAQDAGATAATATSLHAPVTPAATDPIPVPDPVAHPTESASMLWRLYKSGAILPLALVAVFFALTIARKKVPALQKGKVAVWLTASLAGLAGIVQVAATGVTPNYAMWLAAAGTILALGMKPHHEPEPLKAV